MIEAMSTTELTALLLLSPVLPVLLAVGLYLSITETRFRKSLLDIDSSDTARTEKRYQLVIAALVGLALLPWLLIYIFVAPTALSGGEWILLYICCAGTLLFFVFIITNLEVTVSPIDRVSKIAVSAVIVLVLAAISLAIAFDFGKANPSTSDGIRQQLVRVAVAQEIFFAENGEYTNNPAELQLIDKGIDWGEKDWNADRNLFINVQSGESPVYTVVKSWSGDSDLSGASSDEIRGVSKGFAIQGNSQGLVGTCWDVPGCESGEWNVTDISAKVPPPEDNSQENFVPDFAGNNPGTIYPNPGNTEQICELVPKQGGGNVFVPSNPQAFEAVACLDESAAKP